MWAFGHCLRPQSEQMMRWHFRHVGFPLQIPGFSVVYRDKWPVKTGWRPSADPISNSPPSRLSDVIFVASIKCSGARVGRFVMARCQWTLVEKLQMPASNFILTIRRYCLLRQRHDIFLMAFPLAYIFLHELFYSKNNLQTNLPQRELNTLTTRRVSFHMLSSICFIERNLAIFSDS